MSEINTDKGSGGKGKPKKLSTRVDFTPMCDLGFLLITFFMLSTSMSKPQTMELALPAKDDVTEENASKVKESLAVTILLGKEDKVYYYFGMATEEKRPEIKVTDFSAVGIRDILLQRNQQVVAEMRALKDKLAKRTISDEDFRKQATEIKANKLAPVVIIKSTDDATYKNLVDILDEMQICSIAKFAIVDITDYDKELIVSVENPGAEKI